MGLNASSGGRRHLANVQEKWRHNSGDMPWNRGYPSSDSHPLPLFELAAQYGIHTIFLQGKDQILYGYTCRWILKLHQFLYFIS